MPLLILALACIWSFARAPRAEALVGVSILAEERVEHHADGSVKARYGVDDQGRRHGAYLGYHPNGKLELKTRYRKGMLHGDYKSYHPSGKIHTTAAYEGGELQGEYVERGTNGKPQLIGNYEDGRKQGSFTFRDGRRVRGVQSWEKGVLIAVDGVELHPRSLREIRESLTRIYDPEHEWGRAEDESEDPGRASESEEILQDRDAALRRLMAYRFLCGLAWEDMRLSERYNDYTTLGAKLCAEIGQLTHYPKNPGWPKDAYRDAFLGTSSSNMAFTQSMRSSVDGYMEDSDPRNLSHLGHRVWCLEPELMVTGFGREGRVTAMWVKDESRTLIADWNVILCPPAGYLPSEYFGERHAWSVELNSNHFGKPRVKKLELGLWALDEDYLKSGDPLELDYKGVNDYTVIFRPSAIDVSAGRKYLAEVRGISGRKGREGISYIVEFVDSGD